MSWRPKGWDKTRSDWLEKNYTTGRKRHPAFEAGADAILEALEKEGISFEGDTLVVRDLSKN